MVCKKNGWAVPREYSLQPVNKRSLLFHWRVLTVFLSNLSESERKHFQQGREERGGVESDALFELEQEELVEVDSVGFHFEMTRTFKHSGPSRFIANDPISEDEQSSPATQGLSSFPGHGRVLEKDQERQPNYYGQGRVVDGSQETSSGGAILKAWDSHFYLDQTCQKVRGAA
ncbi:hypothetical protein DPMN_008867 [Dreissena polymorpha]|uniref:Uncharacterized protein n=1 Tax=Dreissena polymorpha TaxID=45954 RepID=A0A9D4RXF6_DREPO|nr:hypothetical protein DPMN_008867 [Dreissena polymorpha]